MRVRVTTTTNKLERDLTKIPAKFAASAPRIVERNVNRGHKLAQGIAKRASGPHGAMYYKRITAEMTGFLEGEYGPEGNVVGNAVGAGWRDGPPNTDLPKSADIVGPAFGKQVGDFVGRLFW